MAAPPAYLDECMDRAVAAALRERGIDVLTASEAGREADPDHTQLEYATSQGCVLVSYNRRDFRRLHATFVTAGRPHGGIILLPQASPLRWRILRAGMLLEWFGVMGEHGSRLMLWNDLQQQLLRGLRLVTYSEDEVRVALGER